MYPKKIIIFFTVLLIDVNGQRKCKVTGKLPATSGNGSIPPTTDTNTTQTPGQSQLPITPQLPGNDTPPTSADTPGQSQLPGNGGTTSQLPRNDTGSGQSQVPGNEAVPISTSGGTTQTPSQSQVPGNGNNSPPTAKPVVKLPTADAQGFRSKGRGLSASETAANRRSAVPVKIVEAVATPSIDRGDATIIQYRVAMPDAVKPEMGLNVLLHGDGAASFFDFPNAAIDTDMPLIGLVALAPNNQMTWGKQSNRGDGNDPTNQRPDSAQHSQLIVDLITKTLPTAMNLTIDPKKVFFTGVSGGALTLAQAMMPKFSSQFPSGFLLMCGGLVQPGNAALQPDQLPKRVHIQTSTKELRGLQDQFTIAGTAKELENAITRANVADAATRFTVDGTPNGGHCAFDGQGFNSGIRKVVENFTTIMRDSKGVAGLTATQLKPIVGAKFSSQGGTFIIQ